MSEIPLIGDLLLTFGDPGVPPATRLAESAWQKCYEAEGVCLWHSAPSANWRGFPFRQQQAPGWRFFLLGEVIPSAPILTVDAARQIPGLNGRFLILAYEEAARRWHLWTDRFGTLHAYRSPGALGTFSPAVAAFSARQLDWDALAGFFGFGFFPQDRTHFQDVAILRPASHLVFDASGQLLQEERTWQWVHHVDAERSYDETVDAFGAAFQQVMGDAFAGDGRVALPISGGLDSRSTVAAVTPELAAGGRLWAYSYGYTGDSVETRIARQVAQARQLPFQPFTIRPYLLDDLPRLLAWTEGFQDITQARQASVRDEIANHADALIAALWGDVWLDEMGLVSHPEKTDEESVHQHTFKKMAKSGRTWLMQHLVQPQLGRQPADELLHGFVQSELTPLSGIADADFLVKAFKTEQWSFRWSVPPTRIFQSAAWPRFVFYDTRLADFFCTVPSAFLPGRRLQTDYLKRFAPDLARVTWQVYDANLYQYQHFNTWLLPRRALKKAWRAVSGQKVLQRNWEVQFLQPAGRAGLENWLTRPGLRLHEFLPVVKITELLDSLYQQSDGVKGYTVSMLLTFSAWLEMYG
jgi:hypothetical protein